MSKRANTKGSKNKVEENNTPFVLIILKQCVKFGIQKEMIKSISYNDLLSLIIEFQIDELNKYLSQQNSSNNDEIIEADKKTRTQFLFGSIPKSEGGVQ